MEKISWTDRVRNEEVLHGVKDDRKIPQTITRKKVDLIGHTVRSNCLLKHVFEGKIESRIEVTGRRGRKVNQLLDNVKKMRGYWKLTEEVPDRTLVEKSFWKSLWTCRKTGYGVVRFMTLKHNCI
jgi:hypothetical protein